MAYTTIHCAQCGANVDAETGIAKKCTQCGAIWLVVKLKDGENI